MRKSELMQNALLVDVERAGSTYSSGSTKQNKKEMNIT